MIKKIFIQKQRVNACTLISLMVVARILHVTHADRLPKHILEDQTKAESRYQNQLKKNRALGAGMMVSEALQLSDLKIKKNNADDLKSSLGRNLLKEFFDNKNTFDDHESFMFANSDLILSLMEAYPGIDPDDLCALSYEGFLSRYQGKKQIESSETLEKQLFDKIYALRDPEGMLLTMSGHTISLTKKDQQFYLYDSATGILAISNTAHEIAKFVYDEKVLSHQATEVHVETFFPIPSLIAVHDKNTGFFETSRSSSSFEARSILSHTFMLQVGIALSAAVSAIGFIVAALALTAVIAVPASPALVIGVTAGLVGLGFYTAAYSSSKQMHDSDFAMGI